MAKEDHVWLFHTEKYLPTLGMHDCDSTSLTIPPQKYKGHKYMQYVHGLCLMYSIQPHFADGLVSPSKQAVPGALEVVDHSNESTSVVSFGVSNVLLFFKVGSLRPLE